MLKSICKSCNKEFNYNQHHSKGVYCSVQCRLLFSNLIKKNKIHPCIQCSTLTSNPKFCSSSCAATHNNTGTTHSTLTKSKISASASIAERKKPIKRVSMISWCKICNICIPNSKRKTCSDKCLAVLYRRQGQQLAKSINKRSIQEIELYNLCYASFNNISNNSIIAEGWDADILLNDYNIAIMWNGPWHYKQMPVNNHSLSQVETRDKIKIKLFTKLNWTVLVFEDRYYTPLSAFNEIKLVVDKRIELLHSAYETNVLPLN